MLAEYKTVFEISNKGFTWWFACVGLLPAVVGLLIWWWRRDHTVSRRAVFVSYFFPCFAFLWLVGATIPMWLDYSRLQEAYRSGKYSVVEGRVEDFHPMPPQDIHPNVFECKRGNSVTATLPFQPASTMTRHTEDPSAPDCRFGSHTSETIF